MTNKIVYALLDPRKPGEYFYGRLKFNYEPFYVGKGNPKRPQSHLREAIEKGHVKSPKLSKIRKILTSGLRIGVKVLYRDLTDDTAQALEIKTINKIRRFPEGPLTNLTDGGDGMSGHTPSKKTRKKIGIGHKERWAAMSEKDRSNFRLKMVLANASMSDTSKELKSRKLQEVKASLSPKEKAKIVEKYRLSRISRTKEQKAETARKFRENMASRSAKQKAESREKKQACYLGRGRKYSQPNRQCDD